MSTVRNYGRSVICSKNEPHDAAASVIGISRYINVRRKGERKKENGKKSSKKASSCNIIPFQARSGFRQMTVRDNRGAFRAYSISKDGYLIGRLDAFQLFPSAHRFPGN